MDNGSNNGGYVDNGNNNGDNSYIEENPTTVPTDPIIDEEPPIDEEIPTETETGPLSGLTDNEYVNIPTSSTPITTPPQTTKPKNTIIPVIAGLGAAAIAGIGTKAYLDKKEKEKDEDEIEVLDDEEWNNTDSLELDYTDGNNAEEEIDYITPTSQYAYQEEPIERYKAVNSSESESMQ